MGKFYFAFAWYKIVNLHMCICKNKICIWSDPGLNLPICKYTPVCIWVRMRHLLTLSKICTPEYIYMHVFLVHVNWTYRIYSILSEYSNKHVFDYPIRIFESRFWHSLPSLVYSRSAGTDEPLDSFLRIINIPGTFSFQMTF